VHQLDFFSFSVLHAINDIIALVVPAAYQSLAPHQRVLNGNEGLSVLSKLTALLLLLVYITYLFFQVCMCASDAVSLDVD
jgi:Ca2+/H+ antiporter